MNAHTHTAPAPVLWQDRVTMARANEALGPLHIMALRDEARASSDPVGPAIADACQAYLDCVGYPAALDYLDEIDALLFDEPGEDEEFSWGDFDPSRVHPDDPCQGKGYGW